MQNNTAIGMNRTGLDMAPLSRETQVGFAQEQAGLAPTDAGALARIREQYTQEAERVGSVPIPARLKGMAATALDKLKGNKPEVLLDKLGERLAYERTGVRLYEALIMKVGAAPDGEVDDDLAVDLGVLRRIRDEEAQHMALVAACIVELGADPTAMTPGADVSGVAAQGHLQVMTDPRTTLPQALNSILMIELGDNAGWELLVELADESGHTEMAERFATARDAEREHLLTVQGWLRRMVIGEAA